MTGRIEFKKTTHNAIFVRWDSFGSIRHDSGTVVSPPFILTNDGCPIPLTLSIECQEDFIIRIHQNSSRIGRGIIVVAVKDSTCRKINAVKTYFTEELRETCGFNCLGALTKSAYSYYHLTIDCKIIWLGFVSDMEKSSPSISSSSVATTFSDNKIFPDFTIIVEGQEIPSHKAILARHSSVFLTMFETPMKELKENKVIIEDIECSTMEILLKIIYTGNAENLTDVDVTLKVLHAAEKYEISTIKSLCECKLQLMIDKKNVLELLEIGDKYNALELCETCIAYIMAIKNEEISTEFKKISKVKPNIASVAVNVLMDLSSLMPTQ